MSENSVDQASATTSWYLRRPAALERRPLDKFMQCSFQDRVNGHGVCPAARARARANLPVVAQLRGREQVLVESLLELVGQAVQSTQVDLLGAVIDAFQPDLLEFQSIPQGG
jgi:hypothetical protein